MQINSADSFVIEHMLDSFNRPAADFCEKGPIFVLGKLNLVAVIQANGSDVPHSVNITATSLLQPAALDACPLPRKHRVLIALYALELGRQSRSEILAINNVTEADLIEFQADWLRMSRRSRAQKA